MNNDETKNKDNVLQVINDILEEHDWGGKCEKVKFEFVFDERFHICSVHIDKKRSDFAVHQFDRFVKGVL